MLARCGFDGIGAHASRKGLEFAVAANAPINWTNAMTLASVAVLVGTELVGAGGRGGLGDRRPVPARRDC